MLDLAGLTAVADRRVGGFSMGMGQRLGVATALIGDPATVILDEPVNGLDPDGVLWIRTLVRRLAAEGRTGFLSSHRMNKMAVTADQLVVVGRGRLIADVPTTQFIDSADGESVRVRSPQADDLVALLAGTDVTVESTEVGMLQVRGLSAAEIGDRARRPDRRARRVPIDPRPHVVPARGSFSAAVGPRYTTTEAQVSQHVPRSTSSGPLR